MKIALYSNDIALISRWENILNKYETNIVEDYEDLDVVVFIQNAQTKAIMQSQYAPNTLSTNQFDAASKINLIVNGVDLNEIESVLGERLLADIKNCYTYYFIGKTVI